LCEEKIKRKKEKEQKLKDDNDGGQKVNKKQIFKISP